MKILDFLSGGIVEDIGKVADSLFTSDEERLEKENERIKAERDYELSTFKLNTQDKMSERKNITQRWTNDNQNFITRAVRPFIVVYVVVVFTIVAMFDGNIGGFSIKPSYIPIFETLLIAVIGAYFGSRGFEKVTSIKKGNNAKSEV